MLVIYPGPRCREWPRMFVAAGYDTAGAALLAQPSAWDTPNDNHIFPPRAQKKNIVVCTPSETRGGFPIIERQLSHPNFVSRTQFYIFHACSWVGFGLGFCRNETKVLFNLVSSRGSFLDCFNPDIRENRPLAVHNELRHPVVIFPVLGKPRCGASYGWRRWVPRSTVLGYQPLSLVVPAVVRTAYDISFVFGFLAVL